MSSPEDAPLRDYVAGVEEAEAAFEECRCPIHEGILLRAKQMLADRASRD